MRVIRYLKYNASKSIEWQKKLFNKIQTTSVSENCIGLILYVYKYPSAL